MAVETNYQVLYVDGDIPTTPIRLGQLVMDGTVLKRCTALSPLTYTAITAGGGSPPGGSNFQLQFNDAGAFNGFSNGTAGEILTSNGAGSPPSFQPAPGGGSIWTYTATDRLVSINAGASQSGQRVILAGQGAGASSNTNDLIVLGNAAYGAGATNTDLSGTVVIGSNAAGALVNAATGAASRNVANVVIGQNAAQLSVNMGSCVVIGRNAASSYVGGAAANGAAQASVIIGTDAIGLMNGTTGLENPPSNSVVLGFRSAYGTGGPFYSIADSVVIGNRAMEATGGLVAGAGQGTSSSVIIGNQAGTNVGSLGGANNNVIVGANAGTSITSGNTNTLVGATSQAGASGSRNAFFGYGAGSGASGSDNVAIGHQGP